MFVEQSEEDLNTLLFMGDFKWAPNSDAIEYIVDSVFPALVSLLPQLRLEVVGRNATEKLKRLCERPQITFHGEVDEIEKYVRRAGFILSYVRIGGGVRLKVLESLARGKLVISNQTSTEGIRDKSVMIVSDSFEELASQISSYQNDPKRVEVMKKKAFDYAHGTHSISNSMEMMLSHLVLRH